MEMIIKEVVSKVCINCSGPCLKGELIWMKSNNLLSHYIFLSFVKTLAIAKKDRIIELKRERERERERDIVIERKKGMRKKEMSI